MCVIEVDEIEEEKTVKWQKLEKGRGGGGMRRDEGGCRNMSVHAFSRRSFCCKKTQTHRHTHEHAHAQQSNRNATGSSR